MSILPTPPAGVPFLDPVTGAPSVQWQNFLNSLQTITGGFAPLDARYWVSTSNSDLTNETNLGSLTTGYLQITTAAGIATPSTTTTIPGTDIAGSALTATDDTNVTLALGGTPTTALLRAVSLTLGWTGLLSSARGGTANGFTKFSGPATTEKTFTLPNASAGILTDNALVTVGQGGTSANLSGTGGASQVLQQFSSGGAITVGTLASTNLNNVFESQTFTPAITLGGAATGVTYTSQQGRYLQFGKHVFYTICIQLSSKGSSTGTLLVTTGTLPASVNVSNQFQTTAGFWNNLAAGFTSTPQTYISPNSNVFNPCKLTAGGIVVLNDTDINNNTVIILNGHYETN